MTDDTIIIHAVGYQDDADLEFNNAGEISNHDELVNAGKTFDEIRALPAKSRQHISDSMIVEEGDPMWREEYADMDVGEAKKLVT